MLTMASIPRCWASEAASWRNTSQLASLNVHRRSCAQQVRCVQVRSSIQEEFSPTKEKGNFKNKDFNLPKQPKESDGEKKTTKDSSHSSRAATWPKSYEEAKSRFEDQGPGDFLLYGGAAILGVLLSGALLTSLESYPIVPETMQLIGVACSLFVASRVIQGQPANFKVSPVKAVIEIMEDGRRIQQTSLVLPQDLDENTVATMQRLARERDSAVNQVEEMKRQTSEYSQVLKEKEALETVALQLAEERETATAEVTALKFTVESMSERMKGIEAMLDREIELLKSQNQALETVALQLAQERDVAVKETATLKASSEAEKQALEEVAGQLAKERDDALSELKELMDVVAKMRTPTSG